jgi:biopolymer transport protein ExbD
MEFYRPQTKQLSIPILPLIDILAILLIFLIVTTTFKKKRPVFTIDLPTVQALPSTTITEERVILGVSGEGEISLAGLRVPEGLLVDYLKVYLENNPGRKLELEADQGVTLNQLFGVWDALTEADVPIKEVPARIRIPGGPESETDQTQ